MKFNIDKFLRQLLVLLACVLMSVSVKAQTGNELRRVWDFSDARNFKSYEDELDYKGLIIRRENSRNIISNGFVVNIQGYKQS